MNNLSYYLNFGLDFLKKYTTQYFRALLVPITCGAFGCLIMINVASNPTIALLGLLSIPLFCYAFWKGYVATFALNKLALSYKNSTNETLEEAINELKPKESELAKFLGFCAIASVVGFLPCIVYFFKTIDILSVISNPLSIISDSNAIIACFLISIFNMLILFPFLNFFNQAFFFKKENESFISLIFNCYKKLDKQGVSLSVLFGFLGILISAVHPLLYLIFALLLNLITFSANTLWYSKKV